MGRLLSAAVGWLVVVVGWLLVVVVGWLTNENTASGLFYLVSVAGFWVVGALSRFGWLTTENSTVSWLAWSALVSSFCLHGALSNLGWLPIVVVCLMSALVIKAVTALLEALAWLISRSVDENAETTLLEAWANRISLGNEFEILNEQLLKLGALLTSARGFRTNNSELKELVEELQQLKYQAENLLDELDYYRLEDQIQQRGAAQEKGNYISNSSAATSSSSGFRLASRSILSTLKTMSGLVSLPKTYFSRINLSRRMNELAKELQKSEEKVHHALVIEVYASEAPVLTAWNTKISHTEAKKLHQTSSFLTEATHQTSSFFTELTVFGRDQERDQLMNLLTNEESAMVGQVPVIAIVGSGGVGKTTLAHFVFTNPNIDSYFEVRIWICVSTQFDSVRLTREMLEVACGDRYDLLSNLNKLQKILKDKLESKRFLLVLDDMWEDEDKSQWDLMVAPLNYCRVRGSIILVTTRNQSVAKLVGARDIIYLQGLDDNAFSSFFSTCIFNDPNYGGNWRLRNIGQQIANKLKGNPLVAKTVSAQLRKNLDERYWIEIRDSEQWKSQSGPNDILYALRLNYEHMPIHLQRCFSSCVIFPEDHPFTCKELVYLWMAQGFLNVRSERKMEDIGSAYFNDLFNFGFFQIKQSTDSLVYYTFNDFIHDLAHSVGFKECLTIDGTKPRQILPTIRHLSIFGSTERSEDAIVAALACLKGENLSTIIIWDDELPSGVYQSISDLLKKTKFLRAMRLKLGSMVQQHNFIQNFVSLRYLSLNLQILPGSINTSSYTLPREICRLYHLEVFEIEGGGFLDELPNKFSDLVSLRHFIVEGNLHSKICGVGNLTSLQELNYFDVQENIGFEIEQLGSLKEIGGLLQISNLENVKSKEEASKARLAKKENLDVLYLKWNLGEQETESVLEGLRPNTNLKSLTIDGYGGVASPSWLDPSLIFLESLTLMNCKAWKQLPPIGELEFLKDLKLCIMPLREIGPQFYGTGQSLKFPSLEELSLIDMPDLEKWVWNDQLQQSLCLKKLKELEIRGCTKLVDFPLSGCARSEVLDRFPSLESLKIEDCPPLGFHELSFLRVLEISNISSLESLDLHSFVALEYLEITRCQSFTSLTFGEHLVCLKIVCCKTLSTMESLTLRSWINLKRLHFQECPGFIAAWDSASKEIQRTKPDFSLSLTRIEGDSLALLTLPICKLVSSLQILELRFYAFTEEHDISPQLLTSIDLVDIEGCKNLQSFPFDIFPSLKELRIMFPCIQSLPTNSRTEITDKCLKLRNIKEIYIRESPVKIEFVLS